MDSEYLLEGPEDAPVLVLSNSLGTTWGMWGAQYPALIKRYRVLRYNTRGHGHTPLPAGGISLQCLGQDVVNLLDHLNIAQASFCGISLGGLTGMWLNIHYPKRFSRFVLANTAARIGSEEGWLARAAMVRQQGMGPLVAGSAERWFPGDFRQQQPEIITAMLQQLADISPQGYAACCDVLATADLRSEVTRMEKPLLMIAGQYDQVTTVAEAQWLTECAPQAELCVLPAAHLSSISAATEFNRLTTNFLLTGEAHVTDY